MKLVKIIIAIVILGSFGTKGFTQSSSSCKFEIDKTDATTGKPIKKIKTKLSGTDVFYVIVNRNDTTYQLGLNFWISGAFNYIISKGDVVNILFSGDKNLKLKCISNSKPTPHYSDQTWTEYTPEYTIRSVDLAMFKSVIPKNLKLTVGDEKVFWEFTEKDIQKIKDMVRCVMK